MWTFDGVLSTPTTLNGHKNNFYDRFRTLPWLHDKIINGSFGGILGNSDGEKHHGCILSCVAFQRKFSDEKYDRAQRSPKMIKLKAIGHAFRRLRYPCTECHGMTRADMGLYFKNSHDFERA